MPAQTLRLISWRLTALMALTVCLLAVAPVVCTIVLSACIAAALIGPACALEALAVATLIAYANPAIVKLTPVDGVLLRVVLLAAALRVLPLVRGSDLRLIWPVWLFGLLVAGESYVTSQALDVSIMKAVIFTLGTSTVLIAVNNVSAQKLVRLQSWFLGFGMAVIVLSALTLAKPALGIGGDGGLQGLLSQPQALGILIAPFAAWTLTGALLMRNKVGRLELAFAMGTLILIVLTRARTAAFATAFAVGMVMLGRILARRRAQQASLARPVLIISVAALALGGIALASGKVAQVVSGFAFKDYDDTNTHRTVGGAFYDSRGNGVVTEWQNFLQSPLLGNGFGVFPNGRFSVPVTRFAGIPISAPVEKGFLPTAVLEESGLAGAASLCLLILWLGRRAWRTPDLRWRAMFLACLAVNVGECVFLSPGGIGMLEWLLIGAAIAASRMPAPPVRARTVPAGVAALAGPGIGTKWSLPGAAPP